MTISNRWVREIVARADLSEPSKRLESENWAGAIDPVGSTTLARADADQIWRLAACGLAAGPKLETTVIPFLLRAVNLLGIDSVMQPYENRVRVWDRIASDLPHNKLEEMTDVIGLDGVAEATSSILGGQVRGRLVVDLNV